MKDARLQKSSLLAGLTVPSWQREAPCALAPPEIFYPTPVEQVRFGIGEAADYCPTCPVQLACLRAALARGEDGTWGGMTQQERAALKRRLRKENYATVTALAHALTVLFPPCSECGTHRKPWQNGKCRTCYRLSLNLPDAEDTADDAETD